MKKHRLLIYDVQSRRFKWKLLVLWLTLVGVGLFDIFVQNILGNYWFILWAVIPLIIIIWVYYTFFLPRAWFVVTSENLLLQTPAGEVKISYGRLDNITSSQMAQHYSLKDLPRRDRAIAKPHFKQTCAMVEMNSIPKTLEKKRGQLPRVLFSTKRPGLLLLVEDWIQLSRDVESARNKWRAAHQPQQNKDDDDSRNLAARILEF